MGEIVADVTAVLLQEFGVNMQGRLDAIAQGLDPNSVTGAKAASGLVITPELRAWHSYVYSAGPSCRITHNQQVDKRGTHDTGDLETSFYRCSDSSAARIAEPCARRIERIRAADDALRVASR